MAVNIYEGGVMQTTLSETDARAYLQAHPEAKAFSQVNFVQNPQAVPQNVTSQLDGRLEAQQTEIINAYNKNPTMNTFAELHQKYTGTSVIDQDPNSFWQQLGQAAIKNQNMQIQQQEILAAYNKNPTMENFAGLHQQYVGSSAVDQDPNSFWQQLGQAAIKNQNQQIAIQNFNRNPTEAQAQTLSSQVNPELAAEFMRIGKQNDYANSPMGRTLADLNRPGRFGEGYNPTPQQIRWWGNPDQAKIDALPITPTSTQDITQAANLYFEGIISKEGYQQYADIAQQNIQTGRDTQAVSEFNKNPTPLTYFNMDLAGVSPETVQAIKGVATKNAEWQSRVNALPDKPASVSDITRAAQLYFAGDISKEGFQQYANVANQNIVAGKIARGEPVAWSEISKITDTLNVGGIGLKPTDRYQLGVYYDANQDKAFQPNEFVGTLDLAGGGTVNSVIIKSPGYGDNPYLWGSVASMKKGAFIKTDYDTGYYLPSIGRYEPLFEIVTHAPKTGALASQILADANDYNIRRDFYNEASARNQTDRLANTISVVSSIPVSDPDRSGIIQGLIARGELSGVRVDSNAYPHATSTYFLTDAEANNYIKGMQQPVQAAAPQQPAVAWKMPTDINPATGLRYTAPVPMPQTPDDILGATWSGQQAIKLNDWIANAEKNINEWIDAPVVTDTRGMRPTDVGLASNIALGKISVGYAGKVLLEGAALIPAAGLMAGMFIEEPGAAAARLRDTAPAAVVGLPAAMVTQFATPFEERGIVEGTAASVGTLAALWAVGKVADPVISRGAGIINAGLDFRGTGNLFKVDELTGFRHEASVKINQGVADWSTYQSKVTPVTRTSYQRITGQPEIISLENRPFSVDFVSNTLSKSREMLEAGKGTFQFRRGEIVTAENIARDAPVRNMNQLYPAKSFASSDVAMTELAESVQRYNQEQIWNVKTQPRDIIKLDVKESTAIAEKGTAPPGRPLLPGEVKGTDFFKQTTAMELSKPDVLEMQVRETFPLKNKLETGIEINQLESGGIVAEAEGVLRYGYETGKAKVTGIATDMADSIRTAYTELKFRNFKIPTELEHQLSSIRDTPISERISYGISRGISDRITDLKQGMIDRGLLTGEWTQMDIGGGKYYWVKPEQGVFNSVGGSITNMLKDDPQARTLTGRTY